MPATWSEAIAEAYTLAPAGSLILCTLELRHPAIRDLAGNVAAVRIVLDDGVLVQDGDPPIYGWDLQLEADAPLNAGEVVTFVSCSFEFALPEQKDGDIPSLSIAIDNVARLLSSSLNDAVSYQDKLEVTYREYLAGQGLAPQFVLHGLTVQRVDTANMRLIMTAGYDDLVNFNFPGKLYRQNEFRALLT